MMRHVEVRPGDILLVRTGWITRYIEQASIAKDGWPGLGRRVIPWLFKNDIVAVGADNLSVEVFPFEDPLASFQLHERFIRDAGGYLLEFLDLEELAADKVGEGFFMAAPLRLLGGLGSPLSPVVIT